MIYTLRKPFPGEKTVVKFDHELKLFSFRSELSGDDLLLPKFVQEMMDMRGLQQTDFVEDWKGGAIFAVTPVLENP